MMGFDVAPCLERTVLAQGLVTREESDQLCGKTLGLVGNPDPILCGRCNAFEGL
jgi:hypothetical protein